MKKLSQKLRYFLLTTLVFVSASLVFTFFTGKLESHLIFNSLHSKFTDLFFKYYTNVGDGAFALLLFPFILFFGKIKHLLLAFFSCFFGGMLAQLLKRVFFADALRPKAIFDDGILHIVEGVHLHSTHSFPSGHTASAFAFFIFLAFIGKKNIFWQILCASLAILAGYSRVYLSQHFITDVIAGALVGITAFFFAHFIYRKLKRYKLEKRTIEWVRFAWNQRMKILYFSK